MNIDRLAYDFHTEITKLENEGRGSEAIWSANRLASQGLMNLGLLNCSQTKDYEKAVEIFKMINKIDPGNWLAWSNLTHAYCQMDDYENALYAINKAIECSRGENYDVYYNAGVVTGNLGKIQESEAMYRFAAILNPASHGIGFNLSTTLLRQGKFEEAWRLYEMRFKVSKLTGEFKNRFSAIQEWDGKAYKKKSLVVYSEQGMGDFIMFSRFLEKAKKLGGKLILEIQEPLYDLAKNNFPFVDQIVSRENSSNYPPVPKADYAISVCSLPNVLKIHSFEQISCDPYVSTAQKYKLKKSKALKVGICWCGNSDHTRDITRSIPISEFEPLLQQKNVEFYSLVKGVKEVRDWGKRKIDISHGMENYSLTNLNDKFNSFDELATIVNALDLVITVDTGLAHLCGAMGKPVWILLGKEVDWRWMDTPDTSYWYSSAKLFRRKTSWGDLIQEVVNELPKSLKAK